MEPINITLFLTTLLTIMLSVIGYFMKCLHADFRKMQQDAEELKSSQQLSKAELRAVKNLLQSHVEYLGKRLEAYEQLAGIDNTKLASEKRRRMKAAT